MDNDNTPTLDEVRLAYIDRMDFLAAVTHIDRLSDEEYGAQFDRWLAEHDRSVSEKVWDETYEDLTHIARPLTGNPYQKDVE